MCHKEFDGFTHEGGPNEQDPRKDPESMMQSEISNLLNRLVNLKKFVQEYKDEEMNSTGIQNAIDSVNRNIAINLATMSEIQIKVANEDRNLSQSENEAMTMLENDNVEMRNRLTYLELAKLEYETYVLARSEIEGKYKS